MKKSNDTPSIPPIDFEETPPPETNRLDDDVAEQGHTGDRDVPVEERQTGGRRSKRLRTERDDELRQSER